MAGKRLNLGVRGTRREALLGGDKISGTGGSHPGQESWSVCGGESHIPQSLGTKGNQEGWPSWVEYRSGGTGDPHPGVDIFPDLSPRAKPYCGVKCSQWLHFPATDCGAWGQGTQSPFSKRQIKLGSCKKREPYLLLLWDFPNSETKVKEGTSCLNVS